MGQGSHIPLFVDPIYSLNELKRISRAAFHFEESLDDMIHRTIDREDEEDEEDAIWGGLGPLLALHIATRDEDLSK